MDEPNKLLEAALDRTTPATPPSESANYESDPIESDLLDLIALKRAEAVRDWNAAEQQRLAAAAARRAARAAKFDPVAVELIKPGLGEVRRRLLARTPEQIAAEDARCAAIFEEERRDEVESRWDAFIGERGDRYNDSRLDNFNVSSDPEVAARQQKVLATLRVYCQTIDDRIASGDGLVLFGPKGTGKDHLLTAVALVAIRSGRRVRWRNGMTLFAEQRDSMHEGDSDALINRLVWADVLYLSDPLRPVGTLTEYQMECLQTILDGRYNARRPTWCSVNVANGDELDERIGPQNGDRLRDRSLALYCDWPSHRRTLRIDDLLAKTKGDVIERRP